MTDEALRELLTDVGAFSRVLLPRYALRPYQLEVARAIAGSVAVGGGQHAVVFSRQAGKDEMLAQTVAYILSRYRRRGGSVVVVSPTLRPQGWISRTRLVERLGNALTGELVRTRDATVLVGRARCTFVSAAPGAGARGETASLLLVCNEAQDVAPDRWDAVFDPMAAATNATTVFLGTVWTARTLLARQMRHLGELERRDGARRVWRVGWERVAEDLPAYGERVRARIAQLGRSHPFVRTEYFLEELGDEGGLFPAAVRDRMRGDHPRRGTPDAARRYALLVDVGGEERGAGLEPDARRDATALTVVEVDTRGDGGFTTEITENMERWGGGAADGRGDGASGDGDGAPTVVAASELVGAHPQVRPSGGEHRDSEGGHADPPLRTTARASGDGATGRGGGGESGGRYGDPGGGHGDPPLRNDAASPRGSSGPVYRVVDRRVWVGAGQPELYGELLQLAVLWGARRVVVDATGIGSGLAAFLGRSLPPRTVLPFTFTRASKSDLGWRFLSLCSEGRFRDHAPDGSPEQALFWAQVEECAYEVLPGPGRRLRWGVEGATHDDLLLSAALAAALDGLDWRERRARGRAPDVEG